MLLLSRTFTCGAILLTLLSSPLLATTPDIHLRALLFTKTRVIKVEIHNDRSAPIELKVGDTTRSIPAKETIVIEGTEGTKVYANSPIPPSTKVGDVVFVLTRDQNGSKITFRN